MSVAVDANVLLYASDPGSEVHGQAQEEVGRLARGPDPLYVFWPVISAYLQLATHASVFANPLPLEAAAANVGALLSQPHVRAVGEDDAFWPLLLPALEEGRAHGNLVTDAHLVALMRQYGVNTIVTRDRDLRRWDGIRVHDPFAERHLSSDEASSGCRRPGQPHGSRAGGRAEGPDSRDLR